MEGGKSGNKKNGKAGVKIFSNISCGINGRMREHLKIRERFCIGAGRQMTFLPGSRKSVEQSYRRAMGITLDDEAIAERQVFISIYGLGYLLKPWLYNIKYFRFGADLMEWEYGQCGEGKAICMSRSRARALGKGV